MHHLLYWHIKMINLQLHKGVDTIEPSNVTWQSVVGSTSPLAP